jgi:UTP--glucose-1-phosphate uridylyltransferase
LKHLAVLKLNGGLGTTMGCVGPKSTVQIRAGKTFLDLILKKIADLNRENDLAIPLLLMNSFNTDAETKKYLQEAKMGVEVMHFVQSQHPRCRQADHEVVVDQINETTLKEKDLWYPPGHGDVYEALVSSGVLSELEKRDIRYLFISNVDNLGATVDACILNEMVARKAEFLMELTKKTLADVKGGTLIEYQEQIRLLELAQVPPQHVEEFKSIDKFQTFNTNNIWVSVAAIKRLVETNGLRDMEIIVNPKKLKSGTPVIQLERAMGSAIRFFNNSNGIQVDRSRFLPVKKTDDLLLLRSNVYKLVDDAQLVLAARNKKAPLVKLDARYFGKIADFEARFERIPDLSRVEELVVEGDVKFSNDKKDCELLTGKVLVNSETKNKCFL